LEFREEVVVAKATSISVEKLSATVATAVKAAVAKHPNIKVDPTGPLSLSYLIWGIPVPDAIGGALTIREAQAFANDVAAKLGDGLSGQTVQGTVFSSGGHLIVGFPVPPEVLLGR
jgi:hypothetical protein